MPTHRPGRGWALSHAVISPAWMATWMAPGLRGAVWLQTRSQQSARYLDAISSPVAAWRHGRADGPPPKDNRHAWLEAGLRLRQRVRASLEVG